MALDTDLAYIAGFLDGEGSICIEHIKKNDVTRLKVLIVQTNEDVLRWIDAKLGFTGTVYLRSRLGSLGKKPLYVLAWNTHAAAKVLSELLPYLRVKRLQAEAALEFQSLIGSNGKRVSDENRQRRMALREQIKLLNGGVK